MKQISGGYQNRDPKHGKQHDQDCAVIDVSSRYRRHLHPRRCSTGGVVGAARSADRPSPRPFRAPCAACIGASITHQPWMKIRLGRPSRSCWARPSGRRTPESVREPELRAARPAARSLRPARARAARRRSRSARTRRDRRPGCCPSGSPNTASPPMIETMLFPAVINAITGIGLPDWSARWKQKKAPMLAAMVAIQPR